MGFEIHGAKLQADGCHCSKRVGSSKHKRSISNNSDPQNRATKEEDMDLSPKNFGHQKLVMGERAQVPKRRGDDNEIQNSLRKEILQLEERLQDQFIVRQALEKALGYKSYMIEASSDHSMPKPTKELIREIAVLELEVMYLERYLLSLYRKAYDQQVLTSSPPCEEKQIPPPTSKPEMFQEAHQFKIPFKQEKPAETPNHAMISHKLRMDLPKESSVTSCSVKLSGHGVHRSHSELSQRAVYSAMASLNEECTTDFSGNLSGSGVYRCHSALSQRAVYSALLSPHSEGIDKTMFSYHSQPLHSVEQGRNATSQVISLAEFLGTRIADHVPETPNRLSEELVRCIGSIYCKLAEPPLVYPGVSSSPTTSFSSTSALSPQYMGDMWSPGCKNDNSFDTRLENPFRLEGLKEFSGPYNSMVEVPSICTDPRRLSDVEDLLKSFKSLARRLEKAEVRKMKNEEKLAFWINIHNALVMHAYVHYGNPQNYLKRMSILLKATCNIGGRVINANTIRSYILGQRTHQPGQWMRSLLSPKSKIKTRTEWQAFAIEHPEPLLHFALCSGCHSDPAVRIYNPKRVFQQLEIAKEEYIRATVSIRKEQKILLPKILDCVAKESNMSSADTVDMIQHYLPETLQMAVRRCLIGRPQKCIEWVPHNSNFRYLLSRELTGPLIS